eukprot:gb/GEZN01002983.1/.p1 GENE.gb/GEZN01002983.1/~~gb/GEZN01002983.1/.p1  ORF type:complete len:734 (-),score=141.69 gb/GEZN01002983.1/:81-2282(-)
MLKQARRGGSGEAVAVQIRRGLHWGSRLLDRRSRIFAPTIKNLKATTTAGHALLLRGGYIRQLQRGSFTMLPLAQRVLTNIEQVIDKHLQAIGCSKLILPTMMTKALWTTTGRWNTSGPELFKLKDRRGSEHCLGPTHEEAITHLAKQEVTSYRDLPLRLYQVTTKFRDEERPRAGLLRCREFLMKDLYTFDVDKTIAQNTYEQVSAAYMGIFKELGIPVVCAEADSGAIGGENSREFHVISEHGEDEVLRCRACGGAWNTEKGAGHVMPKAEDWLQQLVDEDEEQEAQQHKRQKQVEQGRGGAVPSRRPRKKSSFQPDDPRTAFPDLAELIHQSLPTVLTERATHFGGLSQHTHYRVAVVRVKGKTEAVFRQEEKEELEDYPPSAEELEEAKLLDQNVPEEEVAEDGEPDTFLVLTRPDRAINPVRLRYHLNALDVQVLDASSAGTAAMLRNNCGLKAPTQQVGLLVENSLCGHGVDLDHEQLFRQKIMLAETDEDGKIEQGGEETQLESQTVKDTAESKACFVNFPVAKQGDFCTILPGDRCIRCNEELSLDKAIEIAHVFYLGTKYSLPFGVSYRSAGGKDQLVRMGCYGIGVSRALAAFVESAVGHDQHGIVWSNALAPYRVLLLSVGKEMVLVEAALRLYKQLRQHPNQLLSDSVLWDDREDASVGVKFTEALLQGFPILVVLGKDGVQSGQAEVQRRRAGAPRGVISSEHVPLEDLPGYLSQICSQR